ncbi:hypothetical protein CGGC5_v016885 [Colletotrichum fructicola Nara gc5]|uniref:Uncharacterized protein n=1 Tax=Colletotrichum fructicola (strain Nara gc5) TaxID=1213859 RepID=A0A7J6ID41_COLFN|nr:hypothetical protein CGGC5_v016885 [Colletotrichum fructicola Nara gc5]
MKATTQVSLAPSKRLVLVHIERRVEDEYEKLTEPSVDDEPCLVRHRRSKELAVCRLTWLQSLDGIRRIAHQNVAAIYSIFQQSQVVFLVHEQLEVGLQELAMINEIHIASALSQVIDGIHHVVAEKIQFPIESIRVTRCGVVKIVLNVCFQPAVDAVADAEQYWSGVYDDVILWIWPWPQRLPLSFVAREFLLKHHEQTLPDRQHRFLERSNGPDGLLALVAQTLDAKEAAVLDRMHDDPLPCDLVTRMYGRTSREQPSGVQRK